MPATVEFRDILDKVEASSSIIKRLNRLDRLEKVVSNITERLDRLEEINKDKEPAKLAPQVSYILGEGTEPPI